MSSNREGSISGTLTLVVVSFDAASQGNQRELRLEDIIRLLDECLATSGESLVENESKGAGHSLSSMRVLH